MEKTNKPTVAGILAIIPGVLSFFWAVALFIGFGVTSGTFDIPGGVGDIPRFVPGIIMGWAIESAITAILALVGGIFAVQRKKWEWALAGSIAAIFAFLPLGIAAVILTAQSKDEFE